MKDELDEILDDALASYTVVEPRAGLAGRVMARVRADGSRARGGWWLAALAAVAFACLAIAIWLRPSPKRVPAVPVRPMQVAADRKPAPAPAPTRAPRVTAVVRRPARDLPRHEKFPTPEPLTPAERRLMAFVKIAPDAAVQLAEPDKPLEVKAIEVRPIEIERLSTGENE